MDNRLREEYLAMPIPEMKENITDAIRSQKRSHPRRKPKLAAVAILAALIVLVPVTVGAAVGGALYLKTGSRFEVVDANGYRVRPNGFQLEEDICAPLSEQAMTNITPYIFTPGDGKATVYETADRKEMELFIDRPMYLPQAADEAVLYRLWAAGADGKAVNIYVQIQIESEELQGDMDVYLLGGNLNFLTFGEPKMYEYALPDGTPVTIAVADTKDGGKVAMAFYKYEDAVYKLSLSGKNSRDLLRDVHAVLDTVGWGK